MLPACGAFPKALQWEDGCPKENEHPLPHRHKPARQGVFSRYLPRNARMVRM